MELGSSWLPIWLGVPFLKRIAGEERTPIDFRGEPARDFRGEPIEVLIGERERGGKERRALRIVVGSGKESEYCVNGELICHGLIDILVVKSMSSSVSVLLLAVFPLLLLLGRCDEAVGFSGEENIPSIGASPCSSRTPVSFSVTPVFLSFISQDFTKRSSHCDSPARNSDVGIVRLAAIPRRRHNIRLRD